MLYNLEKNCGVELTLFSEDQKMKQVSKLDKHYQWKTLIWLILMLPLAFLVIRETIKSMCWLVTTWAPQMEKLKCSDNIKLWFPVRKRILSMLFNTCEIALCDSKSPIHLYFLVKGNMCPLAEVWPLLGDNIAAQHQKKV